MARMTKMQMDHAMGRLDQAYAEILGKHPVNGDGTERLQADAYVDLVRKGTVKISPALVKRAISKYDADKLKDKRWFDSFPEILMRMLKDELALKYQPQENKELRKYLARRDKLTVIYQDAKDELILGDVEKALSLIANFRSTKI